MQVPDEYEAGAYHEIVSWRKRKSLLAEQRVLFREGNKKLFVQRLLAPQFLNQLVVPTFYM